MKQAIDEYLKLDRKRRAMLHTQLCEIEEQDFRTFACLNIEG